MAVTGGAVGYGNFAFNAEYYQDNTFSMPADSNNVVIVGEQLYLGIEPIAIVDGVKVETFYEGWLLVSSGTLRIARFMMSPVKMIENFQLSPTAALTRWLSRVTTPS